MRYNFADIEQKWQNIWEQEKAFLASNDYSKPKFYPLVEFPYPSGRGLHVGHARPYTALDIVARKRRMQGYNVLYTMGWDAFGLPTENFAIANKIHPAKVTRDNVAKFKSQLKSLGFSFDWSREIDTTDPEYYKWTQWIFLKLFEKGLAYKKEMSVNWCTGCKVVLSNEEVVQGVCERCSGEVVHKVKEQWVLGITKYAQRLIDDLEHVDYSDRIKASQINWIGRSEGAEIYIPTSAGDVMNIFTTRPDTLFGAASMIISPEHPFIEKWRSLIKNMPEIAAYQAAAHAKSEFERAELNKEKTGVLIEGVTAHNPATGEDLPIFVADYVLMTYGTGAIMTVPGHDERDHEFAKKYNLPIIEVVSGGNPQVEAYTGDGPLVNSGFLNGMSVTEAKKSMTEYLEKEGLGRATVNYKLRDWVFSRQRYWGEPIPIINCPCCGHVPLEVSDLPLVLPEVDSYEPTDTGESPLANMREWVDVKCPRCGADAKRETDTMPQWAGSSWYFIRYADPHCDFAPASPEAIEYWMPVDWYNGGMEHTTLHLLYSRFWHKFLYDIGLVTTPEPYKKRTSHGVILGENSEKMSKSRGNVINPDDIVKEFGADTLRLYEMFIGDFEKSAPWSLASVRGCKRFLDRVWVMADMRTDTPDDAELESALHKTIKKVSEDTENLKYNTAIAAMMSFANAVYEKKAVSNDSYSVFLRLLAPFVPHIAEELWETCGYTGRLYAQTWPAYDPAKCEDTTVEIAVQVNSKIRARIEVPADVSQQDAVAAAKSESAVAAALEGKNLLKQVYVPGKLINFICK